MVKITIGISFYNNENTLDIAIKSVIYQTFKDWELILIDDGSDDYSVEIASKWVKRDSRVTLICDRKNLGLVYRLNQIIDIARGDFIARMDADDIMLPERLEKQLDIFQKIATIDIVATAAYTIDEHDYPRGIRDTHSIVVDNKKQILKKSLLIHPSILVKKEWYVLNKYDENYIRAEDFELWCRTYEYTNFFRIKEPLLLYREGNININNYALSMKTLRIVFMEHSKGYFTNFELFVEILKTYLKTFLYRSYGLFNLQHLLSSKRNNPLTLDQVVFIKNFICELRNIKSHEK